jgi:Tfp pilus assembly PilM family ATPase
LARYLGIDWDHDRLYVVSVSAGRGPAQVEKAVVWQEPHTLEPGQAEAAGKRLRERLKSARFTPAPVVASLGRERVIFKEIRFPEVPAGQEPAVVRFQATKELTEPAARVVIDYTRSPLAGAVGECRAIVSAARVEWLKTMQALCKGAGLKLVALTPRPFGIAASIQYPPAGATPAPLAGTTVAALVVSGSWAEFTIVRDGAVLFARPLAVSDGLLGDVRRNLALFAGQAQAAPGRNVVQALYFAGDGEYGALAERLQELLAIPVLPLEPFAPGQQSDVAANRAGFAGVVGLASFWGRQQLPLNFVAPKEPKKEVETGKRKVLLWIGGAAAMLMFGYVLCQFALGMRTDEVAGRQMELNKRKATLQQLEPDSKKLAQLKTWSNSDLPIVDEVHWLANSFPRAVGFKVTKVSLAPIPNPDPAKRFTMQMTIKGVFPEGKPYLVNDFMDTINKDPNYQATISSRKGQEFVLLVDLAREPEQAVELGTGLPVPSDASNVRKSGKK